MKNNLHAIVSARAATVAAAQESKAAANGYSKGKHYESARIRAFVTARTGKTFSNESNCDYYFIYAIKMAEDESILCEAVGGFAQHSALVARAEKSPSAKAGAAEGLRLANDEQESIIYEWGVFTSEKVENESAEEKAARLNAAHKSSVATLQDELNKPAEETPAEETPAEETPAETKTRRTRKARK